MYLTPSTEKNYIFLTEMPYTAIFYGTLVASQNTENKIFVDLKQLFTVVKTYCVARYCVLE
jgi:hypothetical protein